MNNIILLQTQINDAVSQASKADSVGAGFGDQNFLFADELNKLLKENSADGEIEGANPKITSQKLIFDKFPISSGKESNVQSKQTDLKQTAIDKSDQSLENVDLDTAFYKDRNIVQNDKIIKANIQSEPPDSLPYIPRDSPDQDSKPAIDENSEVQIAKPIITNEIKGSRIDAKLEYPSVDRTEIDNKQKIPNGKAVKADDAFAGRQASILIMDEHITESADNNEKGRSKPILGIGDPVISKESGKHEASNISKLIEDKNYDKNAELKQSVDRQFEQIINIQNNQIVDYDRTNQIKQAITARIDTQVVKPVKNDNTLLAFNRQVESSENQTIKQNNEETEQPNFAIKNESYQISNRFEKNILPDKTADNLPKNEAKQILPNSEVTANRIIKQSTISDVIDSQQPIILDDKVLTQSNEKNINITRENIEKAIFNPKEPIQKSMSPNEIKGSQIDAKLEYHLDDNLDNEEIELRTIFNIGKSVISGKFGKHEASNIPELIEDKNYDKNTELKQSVDKQFGQIINIQNNQIVDYDRANQTKQAFTARIDTQVVEPVENDKLLAFDRQVESPENQTIKQNNEETEQPNFAIKNESHQISNRFEKNTLPDKTADNLPKDKAKQIFQNNEVTANRIIRQINPNKVVLGFDLQQNYEKSSSKPQTFNMPNENSYLKFEAFRELNISSVKYDNNAIQADQIKQIGDVITKPANVELTKPQQNAKYNLINTKAKSEITETQSTDRELTNYKIKDDQAFGKINQTQNIKSSGQESVFAIQGDIESLKSQVQPKTQNPSIVQVKENFAVEPTIKSDLESNVNLLMARKSNEINDKPDNDSASIIIFDKEPETMQSPARQSSIAKNTQAQPTIHRSEQGVIGNSMKETVFAEKPKNAMIIDENAQSNENQRITGAIQDQPIIKTVQETITKSEEKSVKLSAKPQSEIIIDQNPDNIMKAQQTIDDRQNQPTNRIEQGITANSEGRITNPLNTSDTGKAVVANSQISVNQQISDEGQTQYQQTDLETEYSLSKANIESEVINRNTNIKAPVITTNQGLQHERAVFTEEIVRKIEDEPEKITIKPVNSEENKKARSEAIPEKIDSSPQKIGIDQLFTIHKTENSLIQKDIEVSSRALELPQKIAEYINMVKAYNDSKPHSVVIQLDPPNLGKIKLRVSMKDDRVIAEMNVANFITKEMIEAQLPEIKRSLMQYDIQVSGFNVTLDNNSKFGSQNPNSSQQKWSAQTWHYDHNSENKNGEDNRRRYTRFVNNDSLVDLLT